MSRAPRHERINLWIVCGSQFLVLAGMSAVLPLLPIYLREIGITEPVALRYWTGALGAAPFLVAVFATPIWGSLADRFGHKPMVVRSLAGIATAALGMGLSMTPKVLLAFRGVQGAVSGVFPAAVGLLTSSTAEPRVGRALGLLQSARSFGALSGPLIGGAAADIIGVRALFFVVAGFGYTLAVVSARSLREGTPPASTEDDGNEAGWGAILANRRLRVILPLLTLFQLVVVMPWPTLALYVEELGFSPHAIATTTGLIVFAAGLPAMLTATTWARLGQRYGLERLMVASMVLSGATNLAVGLLATRLDALLAMRAVSGVAMAGFVPLAFTWLNREAPAAAKGKVSSLGSIMLMLASVIGPLFASWLAVHVSLAATFWAPGALCLATGALWTISRFTALRTARR